MHFIKVCPDIDFSSRDRHGNVPLHDIIFLNLKEVYRQSMKVLLTKSEQEIRKITSVNFIVKDRQKIWKGIIFFMKQRLYIRKINTFS